MRQFGEDAVAFGAPPQDRPVSVAVAVDHRPPRLLRHERPGAARRRHARARLVDLLLRRLLMVQLAAEVVVRRFGEGARQDVEAAAAADVAQEVGEA